MNYLRLFLYSILLSCVLTVLLGYVFEFHASAEAFEEAFEDYIDWIANLGLHKAANVILGIGLPIGMFVGSVLVFIRFTLDMWSKFHQ